jgi:hypothetical protein
MQKLRKVYTKTLYRLIELMKKIAMRSHTMPADFLSRQAITPLAQNSLFRMRLGVLVELTKYVNLKFLIKQPFLDIGLCLIYFR